MAHNFRLPNIGFYVSKAGNDSNSGLIPENAKASIGGFLAAVNTSGTGNVAIGTGVYEEAFNFTISGNLTTNRDILADGEVVLRGNGSNTLGIFKYNTTNSFKGFRIENYLNISFQYFSYSKCFFKDIGNLAGNTNPGVTFSYCTFLNVNISLGSATFEYCMFINCNISSCAGMNNCYANGACNLTLSSSSSNVYFNNNIMGNIRVSSTGTYQNIEVHKTSNPGFNLNSFSASPKFNNADKQDFSLQIDSPHIGSGSNVLIPIGGTTYGKPFLIGDMIAAGAALDSLELSGTDLIVSAGSTSGTITFPPVKIADNTQEIEKCQFNGFLLFNKSKTGSTATNDNVPDCNIANSAAIDGSGNPDRLAYEMRWTNSEEQPAVDSQWLNGGVSPGTWFKFEVNSKPLIDSNGRGNGDPAFTPTGSGISAIWVQPRFTLTKVYV